MGRVNKSIEGVFIGIVGTSSEISTYHQFINQSNDNSSEELNALTKEYTNMVSEHEQTFEKLALLEEIIMQKRIRENLTDIKLTLVRDYIYARTPFYRKDKKSKDVRVIVDKMEFHPQVDGDVEKLLGNETFMAVAKKKLEDVMDSEITENIITWNKMKNV
jgi:hypothetical protein